MESEYIVNKNIFSKLCHTPFTLWSDREYWSKCVEKLDLGIIYEPTRSFSLSLTNFDHRYKIIDEKKWLLAKLKYGL
jgi:hypothetical protein